VKPDILAPGHRLGSDVSHATLYNSYPTLRLDANHMALSGTSMAAAVTSGAVAVLLEANRTANGYPAHPSLTANAVKAILQFTALRMHDDAIHRRDR